MSATDSLGKSFPFPLIWFLLLFATAAFSPCRAGTQEWVFVPSVLLRGEYNDNIRLSTADHDAVWLYTAVPRLEVDALSERGRVEGDFRFEPLRYSGGGDLDSNNLFANVAGTLKSEFSEWGLAGAFSRDSTIQSELLDTGITDVSKSRRQVSVAPSWQYVFSEFMTFDLGYDYVAVEYEDGRSVGLLDYDIGTFSADVARLLSEFDSLTLRLYYTAFNAPDVKSEYYDRGITLGYSHVYSGYYRFDITGGARRTKFDNVLSENESSTGFIGRASVTRHMAQGSVRASVERRVDPSGSGTLQQRDSLILNLTRMFTEMMNGSLALGVHRNKSLERDFTSLDRTYYFVTPRLSWQLTQAWSVRMFYRYQYSKYDGASDDAQANVLGAQAFYQWPSPAAGH